MSGHLLKRSTTGHLIRIPFGGLIGGHLGRSGRDDLGTNTYRPRAYFDYTESMLWDVQSEVRKKESGQSYTVTLYTNTGPSETTMSNGLKTSYETFASNALNNSIEIRSWQSAELYKTWRQSASSPPTDFSLRTDGIFYFAFWPSGYDRISAFRVDIGSSERVTAAMFVSFCKYKTTGSAFNQHVYYQFRAPQTAGALMTHSRSGVSGSFVIRGPFYKQTESEANLPDGVITGTIFTPPSSNVMIGLIIVPDDFRPSYAPPWRHNYEYSGSSYSPDLQFTNVELGSISLTPLL